MIVNNPTVVLSHFYNFLSLINECTVFFKRYPLKLCPIKQQVYQQIQKQLQYTLHPPPKKGNQPESTGRIVATDKTVNFNQITLLLGLWRHGWVTNEIGALVGWGGEIPGHKWVSGKMVLAGTGAEMTNLESRHRN